MSWLSNFLARLFRQSHGARPQEISQELAGNKSEPESMPEIAAASLPETSRSSTAPRVASTVSATQAVQVSCGPPPDTGTSMTNQAERLWDRAYDSLKKEDASLVLAYEKILSRQLQDEPAAQSRTSQPLEGESSDISPDPDTRRHQMEHLAREGLGRISKEAKAKERAGVVLNIVLSAKDVVGSGLETMPHLALPWAALCAGLKMLLNPIQQTEENQEGIKYVIGRMNWYGGLSDCLFRPSGAGGPELGSVRASLAAQIVDLYKAILSYQLRSVCAYYRHRGLVFLRDMIALDNWQGDLAIIQDAENRFQSNVQIYGLQQINMGVEEGNSQLARMCYLFEQLIANQEAEKLMEAERVCSGILASLHYRHMDDRKAEINPNHMETFEWLLEADGSHEHGGNILVDWLRGPGALFWLTGKAGSGKSTLMELLYRDPRLLEHLLAYDAEHAPTMAGFFFYDMGTSRLQKSFEGFLRSILHQILSQHRDWIQDALPEEYNDRLLNKPADLGKQTWSWYSLKAAFLTILRQFSPKNRLFLCIDGLDEYRNLSRSFSEILSSGGTSEGEEDQAWNTSEDHKEIAQLIRDTACMSAVKVCISSRPLVVFTDAFAGYPSLRLHDVTAGYIRTYVQRCFDGCDRIRANARRGKSLSIVLTESVVSKADGVFLWVRLVVERTLKRAYDGGTWEDLYNQIESSPSALTGKTGLYSRMLQDIDPQYRTTGTRIFQLIQASDDPLSPLMLHFAEEGREGVFRHNFGPLSDHELNRARDTSIRRLKSMCAGLLEVEQPTNHLGFIPRKEDEMQTIKFIHRMATEFIAQHLLAASSPADSTSFCPHECLLAGYVARLKYAPYAPGECSIDHAVISAMKCAKAAESYRGENRHSQANLLDELDRTMAAINFRLVGNLRFEEDRKRLQGLHWASNLRSGFNTDRIDWVPKDDEDFASLSVQAGLTNFMQHKLESNQYSVMKDGGIPLLAFAVFNEKEHWFQTRSNPGMVKLLLAHGADPNKAACKGKRTPWQLALQWAYNDKVMQRSAFEWCNSPPGKIWTDNVLSLVTSGADVNAWLYIRVTKGTYTFSPVYVVIDLLRGNEDARDDLVSEMKKHGARLYFGEKDSIREFFAAAGEYSRIRVRSKEESRWLELEGSSAISLEWDYVVVETRVGALEYVKRLEKLLDQLPEGEAPPKPQD